MIQTQFHKNISVLRTDNGRVFSISLGGLLIEARDS